MLPNPSEERALSWVSSTDFDQIERPATSSFSEISTTAPRFIPQELGAAPVGRAQPATVVQPKSASYVVPAALGMTLLALTVLGVAIAPMLWPTTATDLKRTRPPAKTAPALLPRAEQPGVEVQDRASEETSLEGLGSEEAGLEEPGLEEPGLEEPGLEEPGRTLRPPQLKKLAAKKSHRDGAPPPAATQAPVDVALGSRG